MKRWKYWLLGFLVLVIIGLVLPDRDEVALTPQPPLPQGEGEIIVTAAPSATITDTAIPTITPEPRATATLIDEATMLRNYVQAFAEVEVLSSQIADGRANGGDRTALIAFVSDALNMQGLMLDMGKVLGAVAAAIQNEAFDLDTVSLIFGYSEEKTEGIATARVSDIRLYLDGVIDEQTLMGLIAIEAMP